MKENALDSWVMYFKYILDMPCPPEHKKKTDETAEMEKRDSNIIWKLKGRVSRITFALFNKYGSPEKADNQIHAKMFSGNFHHHYSIPLLESHLQILFSHATDFIGTKTLIHSIRYISESIKIKNTMNKLKPYISKLLCDTIIPLLLVT